MIATRHFTQRLPDAQDGMTPKHAHEPTQIQVTQGGAAVLGLTTTRTEGREKFHEETNLVFDEHGAEGGTKQ